ncbi:hypothetical protein D5018_20335 [Parashewanella curva]|uniref:Uncharacterized protein n=1 Tax=Parashewanella curva TaxID=2338552 RepID=A0A3L8PSQ8_9GAMM|nr:hypothetical protein [Parashewanella curva]RLV57859.1 hypothetical protein D5018_20335 [Parashewanella curva]
MKNIRKLQKKAGTQKNSSKRGLAEGLKELHTARSRASARKSTSLILWSLPHNTRFKYYVFNDMIVVDSSGRRCEVRVSFKADEESQYQVVHNFFTRNSLRRGMNPEAYIPPEERYKISLIREEHTIFSLLNADRAQNPQSPTNSYKQKSGHAKPIV